MSDQDVLNLALHDKEESSARIEGLQREIAEAEERIRQIDAFVATYQEYEQRLTGSTSEGGQPEEGWQGPN